MVQIYKQDHISIYASHATLLPFVLQAHSMVRWKYFRFVQYVCVTAGAHKLMLMNYTFCNTSCCFKSEI